MAKQANVISHWHRLIENFQASSLDFYESVETAVQARLVPEMHTSRIEHKEGGLASANRQYLRFHRGRQAFDICAAPFGTGFFVSWWFTEPPLRFAILYTFAFLSAFMIAMSLVFAIGFSVGAATQEYAFGVFLGGCGAFIGVPLLFWVIGNALRHGGGEPESTVLAIPLIGSIYEWVFAPSTFYAIDTGLMFQDAVHNAVLEVIDRMTAAKGIRALTEAERKPTMTRFAASV
jgi:hypothetical protein